LSSGNPVVAYASYVEAVLKAVTNTLSSWAAAHSRLELQVRQLAAATNRPVQDVLDDLDALGYPA